MDQKYELITILGPTACGKTTLAVNLALEINGEIISADSRQVYRGMDIGTGKDIDDYTVNGKQIPYHLIDIVDAGYKYNVYEFQQDFIRSYNNISEKNKMPILCGGTGMYIDAVTKGYKLIKVPVNNELRKKLEKISLDELSLILSKTKNMHNKSDISTKKRAIRAIEIEEYYKSNPEIDENYPQIKCLFIGVKYDRDSRRKQISQRLKQRLDEGMIDEVQTLIDKGINSETLLYYGLEYKYLTLYLTKQLSYNEMFTKLEIAIHQFAKRQMTWFRSTERKGVKIHWIDGYTPIGEKIIRIKSLLNEI